MHTKRQRIILASDAAQLPKADFRQFERRPANYYRDMIVEEGDRLNEQEFNGRIEQLIATEKQGWMASQQVELQRRFEAGLVQGRQETGTEFKRALELLTEYGRVLQAEKREAAERGERNSVELAFMLAKKILGCELEMKPDKVVEIARMALQQVLDCDQVELKVNPEDFTHLRTVQSDLQALLSSHAKLELRADNSLERGSCLVETERGTLDARVSSQLETLRANVNVAPASQA